jgi:hypothetical protein
MAEALICQITEAVERHARAIDVRAKRRPDHKKSAASLAAIWHRHESHTALVEPLTREGVAAGTADDIAARLHEFADGVRQADPRVRFTAHSALIHLVKDGMVQFRKAQAVARNQAAARASWTQRKDIG